MYCCRNCFSSNYLKSFFNEQDLGDCNFCNSKNLQVLSPSSFFNQFKALLSYYEIDSVNGSYIETQIIRDFPNQIFDVSNELRIRELLEEIIKEELAEHEHILKNKIILKIKSNDGHIHAAEKYNATWENFKEEIKFINRFHTNNIIDLKKLATYFVRSLSKDIPKGETFYRGRISGKSGFSNIELWNPPKEKAKAGRANPYGISYLYLSDQIKTSLYETRSTIFDYVTIGEFVIKDSIKIIDLRDIIYEPIVWAETEDLEDYLVYIPFLDTLQMELSLPIRSNDKEIDYLPTQYLSEFIKSLGYDGVKFQSSLYSKGFNLAIFNPSKFELNKSEVYEIQNIDYLFKPIT